MRDSTHIEPPLWTIELTLIASTAATDPEAKDALRGIKARRVTTIGLHPIARTARHRRGRDHQAVGPELAELPGRLALWRDRLARLRHTL